MRTRSKVLDKYRDGNNEIMIGTKTKNYFKTARNYSHSVFHYGITPDINKFEEPDWYYTFRRYWRDDAWNAVKKIVLNEYGCIHIEDMPNDKQKEANNLAIKIIDELYDEYLELEKEYYKEKKEGK